jgi:hypothetical protein
MLMNLKFVKMINICQYDKLSVVIWEADEHIFLILTKKVVLFHYLS